VIKLDDVLRDRTDKLQVKRQAILAEIAGRKTQTTLPFLTEKNSIRRDLKDRLFSASSFHTASDVSGR
jgi:hypothetical protein